MVGTGFISNIDKKDKDVLIKAAQTTNTRIHFNDRAIDGNGKPVKGCVGVYTVDETQEYSEMWQKFSELKSNGY